MKIKQTLGLLVIALPLSSFATPTFKTQPATLQLSPNVILEHISQQIGEATTQMNTNDATMYKQQNTYWQQQQKSWSHYFQQNNVNSNLQQASEFNYLAQNYVGLADSNQAPLGADLGGFPCGSNNPAGAQICGSSQQPSQGYSDYDSRNIMSYQPNEPKTFTGDKFYIQQVVAAGNNDQTDGSAQVAQLAAVSAVENSLNQVLQSYVKPAPVNTTVKNAQGKSVTQVQQGPSRMQALHNAIKAPYTKKYSAALASASNTQVNRQTAQLIATANTMRFKIIKQLQSLTIVNANLLSQQIQANALARENLAATRALLKSLHK